MKANALPSHFPRDSHFLGCAYTPILPHLTFKASLCHRSLAADSASPALILLVFCTHRILRDRDVTSACSSAYTPLPLKALCAQVGSGHQGKSRDYVPS